jgi:hypothetical protein
MAANTKSISPDFKRNNNSVKYIIYAFSCVHICSTNNVIFANISCQIQLQRPVIRETMKMAPHSAWRSRVVMPFSGLAASSLCLLLFLLPMAVSTIACLEQEKSSLLRFLAGLSHDNGIAMSWRNGMDCCEWEGITCSEDGAVIEVSLASKGLEGRISPSLGELTSLSRLNLSYNSLSGGLPAELMSSGSIVVLDVSFNHLNGNLPLSASARHLLLLLTLATISSVAASPQE